MCHGPIISLYQGPIVCQELFLSAPQFSAVNGMALLWKHTGLLCRASTAHISPYHRYLSIMDSAASCGPSRAAYTTV